MATERTPSDSNSNSPQQALVPTPLSPAVRRRLQQCYEHASKLMSQEKYDCDYANTLLSECVTQDPGHLPFVNAFLQNLKLKYKNNKKGSMFAGLGGKGPFKKAIASHNWPELLKLGPGLLKSNPWDLPVLHALAEANAAFNNADAELCYLKFGLDAHPTDAEINRHCAKSLQRLGEFDQAIACWHRLEQILPKDEEAPRMIGQLQIEKTRTQAGFADPALAISSTDNISSPSTPPADASLHTEPSKRREIQLTPRQLLDRSLKENPDDLDSLLQLADLHLQGEHVADAEKLLAKAQALSANDLRVRERIENASLLRARQKLQVAERMAAAEKTKEHQDLVSRVRIDLNRQELDVFAKRTERYPEDYGLKHQLALRLKRAGNYAEAVKIFAAAAQDEPHRSAAMLELGECQQMLRRFDKALDAYRIAISSASDTPTPDNTELKILSLYRGAVLATALKDAISAEQWLLELLKLAPNYKDARDRLDKIRQIRDK